MNSYEKSFYKNKDNKVSSESNQTKKGSDTQGPKVAQPENVQTLVQTDTNKVSGSKGVKPKARFGNCRLCHKY